MKHLSKFLVVLALIGGISTSVYSATVTTQPVTVYGFWVTPTIIVLNSELFPHSDPTVFS